MKNWQPLNLLQYLKATNQKILKNKHTIFSIFLLSILYSLIHQVFIAHNLLDLKNYMQSYNYKLQKQYNDSKVYQALLTEKLNTIYTDLDTLESLARYELGLVKNNEKYYNFPTVENKKLKIDIINKRPKKSQAH